MFGKLMRWFVALSLLLTPAALMAAEDATNAIDGIVGTASYAKTTITPVALGLVLLCVGVAVGVKLWRKLFSKA